jgi:hypothetical protein
MNDSQPAPESPEPWEQRSGEPNRWYSRFEIFRLAGPNRSLLGVVNADRQQRGANKAKSIPQAWSKNAKKWNWRERAEAWDQHERQVARAAHAKAIEDMNRRHLQEARAFQHLAAQRIKAMNLEKLSPADTLRFCIEAAKLERLALGVPETIEEQRLTGATGGAVAFTVEAAVRADQELKEWNHERIQQQSGGTLPEGDLQVP